jgi:hypothetical protein
VITFASTFGSALAGAYVRDRLPAPHLSKESQDVVRLGMGLVATMTALLLGLVTAAARRRLRLHRRRPARARVNTRRLTETGDMPCL